MTTIFKFPLHILAEQIIELPKDAQILSVQTQQGQPAIWAIVDPSRPTVPTRIRMYGTGHTVDKDIVRFLGTVQQLDGQLIWHFFLAA